jgi:hypothetical protein
LTLPYLMMYSVMRPLTGACYKRHKTSQITLKHMSGTRFPLIFTPD